jgi:probable metal-binding protein
MATPIAVHGHEIIDLVSAHAEGIRLSQLAEAVNHRFGTSTTFHTCSSKGMDLDALLAFLESRNKVRIVRGVVFSGDSPACDH